MCVLFSSPNYFPKQTVEFLEMTVYLKKSHNFANAIYSVLSGMMDDILVNLDSGTVSFLLLIDFFKAFDTFSHEELAAQQTYYDFTNEATCWVESRARRHQERL